MGGINPTDTNAEPHAIPIRLSAKATGAATPLNSMYDTIPVRMADTTI